MSGLADKRCVPCTGSEPPLAHAAIVALHAELDGSWTVVDDHHLVRRFTFTDFAGALDLTNAIGSIAEEQGHHPDILLGWGKVEVTIWTHAINGLSEADFILAAKIDRHTNRT